MSLKKAFFSFVLLCTIATLTHLGFGVAVGLSGRTVQQGEKQILADGDMEASGVASWTSSAATLSKQTVNPHSGNQVIRITKTDGSSWAAAKQTILTAGKTYKITGFMRGDGVISPRVATSYNNVVGTTSTDWQPFTMVSTIPPAGDPTLYLNVWYTGATDTYTEFDDIMVTEYKGTIQNAEKQLLTDGDMEAVGTASWGALNGAVLSKVVISPYDGTQNLKIVNSDGGVVRAAYQNILTVGKSYHITGWARSDGTITPYIYVGTAGSSSFSGTLSTDWQRVDVVATANSVTLAFSANALGYIEFDDIMVTEYKGTIQNAEKQLLTDGDMEAVDTSAWLASNSVLSKGTDTPKYGDRYLRVTYNSGTEFYAAQVILVAGKRYKISGWGRGDGTRIFRVYFGNVLVWTGENSTDWQYFESEAVTDGVVLYIGNVGVVGYVEFDDIFITRID